MKALITGSAGFYGSHLKSELENNGYDVICCDIKGTDGTLKMDITNSDMVMSIVDSTRPDVLINMAGQANVGLSWSKPQLTFELNTLGMINILEAVKAIKPNTRVIAIGSSDEYGNLKDRGVNVTEDIPVNPITPYAISKLAQEQMSQLYNNSFGMNVCMVRQFNLGGAGQMRGFMISDFASGIAEIEAGKKEYLSVGNLDSARDFTHVRDACRALRLIAEKGQPGEIYNICSGKAYTAREVLHKIISLSTSEITVKNDFSRMRPSDTPVVCGNNEKLTAHTGWTPILNLEDILEDAIGYWRNQVIKEGKVK